MLVLAILVTVVSCQKNKPEPAINTFGEGCPFENLPVYAPMTIDLYTPDSGAVFHQYDTIHVTGHATGPGVAYHNFALRTYTPDTVVSYGGLNYNYHTGNFDGQYIVTSAVTDSVYLVVGFTQACEPSGSGCVEFHSSYQSSGKIMLMP